MVSMGIFEFITDIFTKEIPLPENIDVRKELDEYVHEKIWRGAKVTGYSLKKRKYRLLLDVTMSSKSHFKSSEPTVIVSKKDFNEYIMQKYDL